MTSWEKQYSININEQRKSLNKLEEDIERELAELQNLSKSTGTTNKRLKTKISQHGSHDPNVSALTMYKSSESRPNIPFQNLSTPLEDHLVQDEELHIFEQNQQSKDWKYKHPEPFSNQNPVKVDDSEKKFRSGDLSNLSKHQIMDLVKELEDKEIFRTANNSNKPKEPLNHVASNNTGNKQRVEDRLMNYGLNNQKKRQEMIENKERVIKQEATPNLTKTNFSRSKSPNIRQTKTTITEEESNQRQGTQSNNDLSINHYISLYQAEYGDRQLTGGDCNLIQDANVKDQDNYEEEQEEGPVVVEHVVKNQTKASISHGGNRYQVFVRTKNQDNNANKENPEQKADSFRPNFNKKSLEIASRLGDPFQRLVSASIDRQKQSRKKTQQEMERDLTFKPKINKESEALDQNFKSNVFNGDKLYRWDQLYLMKDKYKIDMQMRKLELEKQALENDECTFHPDTAQSKYHIQRSENTSLADRSKLWEQQRQQKILRERQENQDKELEGCTFKPQLQETRSKSTKRIQNTSNIEQATILDTTMSIRGADRHFERIELAKRIKNEKEALLKRNQGQNWQYKRTIPREPKLGRQDEDPYRTLRNPVSPMGATPHSPHMGRRTSSIAGTTMFEDEEEQQIRAEIQNKQKAQANQYQTQAQLQLQQQQMIANNYAAFFSEEAEEPEDDFTNVVSQLHTELHKIKF